MKDLTLADRLRARGLYVVEIDGWQDRGRTYADFQPQGSVDHHTAGGPNGDAPSLGICINGRSDLPGPLCQAFQARSNIIYVVAAGLANHAGAGGWRGLTGNASMHGLESENVGTGAEPWRPDQIETKALVHAAFLDGTSRNPDLVCEHKEWTRTKIDSIDIDGGYMRQRVGELLGTVPVIGAPPPPPQSAPEAPKIGRIAVPNIYLTNPYTKGRHVKFAQGLTGKTGRDLDGIYGPNSAAGIKGYQARFGLPQSSTVNPRTWCMLLQAGLNYVAGANLTIDGWYGEHTTEAVLTFQGAHGLQPDAIAGYDTFGVLTGL